MNRSFGPALLAALLLVLGTARAHVKYVTEGGTPVDAMGFLADALSEPLNLMVVGAGVLATAGLAAGYLRFRPARTDLAVLRATLESYRDLVPWLLRLSVGLPLVAAGFGGYFFTPLVPAPTRLFGITLGFLLLFGLATRAAAGVGLLAYLVGLAFHPELLLAVEYVPAFVAIVLLGGGRPSADEVLARMAATEGTLYGRVDPVYRRLAVPFDRQVATVRRYVPTVVRVGLGAGFVYLGLTQKLLAPGAALAVVEKYALTAVVPVAPELWVLGAGLLEIGVGVALLAGLFTRAAAGTAFLLFTLTLFGLPDDPVLAHVSLFGLVSVLLVTGGGPLALDAWLADRTAARGDGRQPAAAD